MTMSSGSSASSASSAEWSETIDCIDCGGRCHLLTTWPADDPPQPGDVLVYRCEDCLDRWDIVIPDDGPEE
jgi:predicted RNA-binding Zn-ribbon protein involved in translation (DUF1610 family)